MLQCYMCKFYHGRKGESSGDCYGAPPQIAVSYPNGNMLVESFRPEVKAMDPMCSLFVTHPDCLGGIR